MDVEARATTTGYRLAQQSLKGQVVWWWQRLDDPDDPRQPCWLEKRQAIAHMQDALDHSSVVR